ncbi:MAG: TIGR03936 family radical SAM-associated protein [Actinomycetota bacterium]|nr:TIGR03936 family radical SAM-associated protein [Actinomycetota bacterium]
MTAAPVVSRVRLRFTKTGKIRWTSHRDVARMWERAFRRVGLPLAYSAGFSPRPKVSFGLALPTGHESVAEYLDIELSAVPPDLDDMMAGCSAALPVGVDVTAAALIEPRTSSLQESVASCTWRWAAVPALPPLPGAGDSVAPGQPVVIGHGSIDAAPVVVADIQAAVARLLAASEVIVTRRRKGTEVVEDIRPSIEGLRVAEMPPGDDDGIEVWLEADLATQPRSIRPIEVLRALDPALDERHVCRLHQWILRDGARHEPLISTGDRSGRRSASGGRSSPAEAGSVAATDAPHVLGRAS